MHDAWPQTVSGWELAREGHIENYRKRLANRVTVTATCVLEMAANLLSLGWGNESPADSALSGEVGGTVGAEPGTEGIPEVELTFTLVDGRRTAGRNPAADRNPTDLPAQAPVPGRTPAAAGAPILPDTCVRSTSRLAS